MPKQPRSIKFSRDAMRLIKAGAKKTGKSISAFVAEAAEAKALELQAHCPTCGKRHATAA